MHHSTHALRRAHHRYHGNRYHGYPPDHPMHKTFGVGHTWGAALYNKTRRRTEQYIKGPLVDSKGKVATYAAILEVWEHSYLEYKKAVKSGAKDAQLEIVRHECDPDLDVSPEAQAQRDVDATVPPEYEDHAHGGGCLACPAARRAAREAAAAAH